ncbi:hypothetical protein AMTRI_Chr05g74310 [Amborella trichopoda]|uniref:Uncharacterized protein n=1 Tax=Amborella trichopoda TaxID=13333 RepID=W1P9T0_AMBTC|nr:EIN3-binding F-box protein 1 [Amborella trichopoda]ERN03740.1 hypothetical protein AMTR_s00078p00046140 [Amborella trichopoda]|eukprot:XP_006842065.1 EIN3-binding F-box protein 1 [Amborella trichopoda]
MSTLVKYSGDDRHGGPLYSSGLMDSSLFLSLAPNLDVYCPPRKRSRVTAPFVLWENNTNFQRKPSLDNLPDECLFEILRRVNTSRDRSACACVSKHWLMLQSTIKRVEVVADSKLTCSDALANQEDVASFEIEENGDSNGYLSRSLRGNKATDVRLAAIAVGTGGRGGLGKLLVGGSNPTRGVTDLGLSAIAHGCPALKALSLWNTPFVSDEGLSEIADGCPQLEKLDLCQCPRITDKGLIAVAKKCPSLTTMNLESCEKIGNGALKAIAQSCPNLRSVSIHGCPLIGDQGVASLVSLATHVSKIKLQSLNITDVSLALIGHYGKEIEDLGLVGLHNVSERGFWALGNALGLQKLKLCSIALCMGITDLGLEAIGRGCPNLKQLCLRRCSSLSDKGLEAFTQSAVLLKSLQLEECNKITQMGLLASLFNCRGNLNSLSLVKCMGIRDSLVGLAPLSTCNSLKSLSVRHCSGFGNGCLDILGKACPQLQNLDLSGLCGVTDDGFVALLESREALLLKANLSGCINLTDRSVMALAKLHGESLELLSFEGCGKVTDSGLMAVSSFCVCLKDLDISRCTITDNGLAYLSRAKGLRLQILSLSACLGITDKSLPLLGNFAGSLVGLNLQNCKMVSNGAVELLGEQLWRCDILF